MTFDDLESDNAKRASLLTRLLAIARNRYVIYLKRNRPVIDGEAIVIGTSTSSLLIWVQEGLRQSP